MALTLCGNGQIPSLVTPKLAEGDIDAPQGLTSNQQIVNILVTKIQATEDFIHKPLKRLCSIA